MSGMSPWNYGNFYMGNTTMQMMPYMQRKVAKYALKQGMSSLGGFGGGMPSLGGFGGGMPMMPMLPMMPMMPCLPASCSMPMASPIIAAATPLPIAYNPIVQGMYPMVGMNSASWMTPSSFMSALTTGPMPYRPPASIEFPSNINMVMTLPYGTPNPLLCPPSFGGFSPQYNFGGGMSCCCCYCTPSACPPAISYYPQPVSVPQPVPVPYPVPVPIPNIQQVPIPRPVSVVAPPIIAGGNQSLSIPSGAPLLSSQGGFMQGGMNQQLVMASNQNSTTQTLLKDKTSEKFKRQTSTRKSIDQARRAKAQKLASSLSNLGLENSFPTKIPSSRRKHRVKSNRISSFSVSDCDHLTSDTLSSLKRPKKSTHRHSESKSKLKTKTKVTLDISNDSSDNITTN